MAARGPPEWLCIKCKALNLTQRVCAVCAAPRVRNIYYKMQ